MRLKKLMMKMLPASPGQWRSGPTAARDSHCSRWLTTLALFATMLWLAGCHPATRDPALPLNPSYRSVTSDRHEQLSVRKEALDYLKSMTLDEYALYRANAIEGLQNDSPSGEEAARKGLLDTNLGVRFVAAMAIGQHQYADAAPLTHALLNDPSESVQAAAAFALKRNGTEVDLSVLSRMLKQDDMHTAANAAMVLGELGDPSAISMLRDAMTYRSNRMTSEQQRFVQLQIAEAMAKLGDPSAISRIRAQLYSRRPEEGELTALAANMLGELDARITIPDLRNIVAMWKQYRNSAEVRLAALTSLALLNDPQPLEYVLDYLGSNIRKEAPETWVAIRSQAVYALSVQKDPLVLPYLVQVFDTEMQPQVKIQAASDLLRLIPAAGPGESVTGASGQETMPDKLTPGESP